MISTLLADYSSALPFLFFALLAACVPVGWLLAGAGNRGRRWAAGLAVIALLATLPLTLWPDSGQRWAFCSVQFSLPWLAGGDRLANLAMMLPAAFFGTLATRRPLAIAAAGSGLSALIELTQALLPALGRSCDTDDWEMNTIGVTAGALLGWGLLVLLQRTVRSVNGGSEGASARAGRGGTYWLVSATTSTAVVVCVVLAALHAQGPAPIPEDGPCSGGTSMPATQLPDGISAYAARNGGVCILTATGRLSFPPRASGRQLTSDDHKWQVGIAQPGASNIVDTRGTHVRPLEVDGTKLRVWAAPTR
jgi:hypothetical protein